MNRFKNWLTNLSLSQQLFVLIFLFISFFASFFFVFLTGKVDEFVSEQMFIVIDRNQDMISNMYYENLDPKIIMAFQGDDSSSMYNVFYTDQGNFSTASEQINEIPNLSLDISNNLRRQSMNKIQKGHYSFGEGENKVFYAIKILSEDFAFVSVATHEYQMSYRDDLLSSVVNITVLVVGLMFVILMIWMASLIHPINQIRNYIEKIRLGEEAELKINRNDEIGELAEAIVNMRQEISRQERVKEEMIHNISHDLKTPIATIKSYGESIKDGIYPYDTLEKSVDVIINNAERLEKKVHSLLYLNRVEYLVSQSSGEEEANIKVVAEEVLQALKLIRNDVEIVSELEDAFYKGSFEPWRITIENLMDNALRYAKDKVVLKVNEEEISIWNNGPQMSDERINTLFKPFEKGQGGQFGIGLSIVYKVTSANGYIVSGENTLDGVIFRITTPPHKNKNRKQKNRNLSDDTIKDAKFETKEK
ncbi:MAG: ATP-binding protein [Traorella sp.]